LKAEQERDSLIGGGRGRRKKLLAPRQKSVGLEGERGLISCGSGGKRHGYDERLSPAGKTAKTGERGEKAREFLDCN